VTILFAEGVAEVFDQLPEPVKHRAAQSLDLLSTHPRMYPIRRRGLFRGYRFFVAGSFLFFYEVAGGELRLSAILPGMMRRA
jgi:plasmid stabilization system protein ParE